MTVVCQEVAVEAVKVALLLICGTIRVLAEVLDLLALRVAVVREELGDGDPGRVRLAVGVLLLLLAWLSLFLFLRAFSAGGGTGVLWLVIIVGPVTIVCGIAVGSVGSSRVV